MRKYNVIIPADLDQQPEEHEVSAARIIARYLGATATFLQKRQGYRQNTPDIEVQDEEWEIKSPQSDKIDKVRRNISEAIRQSRNIVIDTRRTRILDEKILAFVKVNIKPRKNIRQLLIIKKDGKVEKIR